MWSSNRKVGLTSSVVSDIRGSGARREVDPNPSAAHVVSSVPGRLADLPDFHSSIEH